MQYQKIYLKPGKEIPVLKRHHWLFSGAIQNSSGIRDGAIVEVYSYDKRFIGHAFHNSRSQIQLRMINFSRANPIDSISQYISSAIELREKLFDKKNTNAYRLINGEGDLISGLTVDRYNDALVLQVASLGVENIKNEIIDILVDELDPKMIYEKSEIPSRKNEGMEQFKGKLYGENIQKAEILENGKKFLINFPESHKTGFYLDQREMREFVGSFTKEMRVLNCFSYTGGFSVYSALGGAKSVTSADISKEVIEQAKENFVINNLDVSKSEFIAVDVFEYLKNVDKLNFDFVILDPPAFAKKKDDIQRAMNGYGQINRTAMKKMPKGSFLLTCSCSYHVDEQMFKSMLQKAAFEAGRNVKILRSHIKAPDHALNIFHPEMDYLKSFLLYLE